MENAIEITKAAFIARLNQRAARVVVNTKYEVIDGAQKLVLVYSDGSRKIFKGLRAA